MSSQSVQLPKKLRKQSNETPSPSTSRTPEITYSSSNLPGSSSSGLRFGYEPQQPSTSLTINTTAHPSAIKESPPSSPGSEASARKRSRKSLNVPTVTQSPQPSPSLPHHVIGAHPHEIKEHKDPKIVQNGVVSTHHMLGNQLNPSSSVAQKMTDTLNMEIEAHSIYSNDSNPNLVGPLYPGRKLDPVRFSFFQ
jgi:hypothetical protein